MNRYCANVFPFGSMTSEYIERETWKAESCGPGVNSLARPVVTRLRQTRFENVTNKHGVEFVLLSNIYEMVCL